MLLFVKYVSDKHAGVAYAPIEIPEGASFDDLVAMKGHKEIGDRINKEVLAPLQQANPGLSAMPDFNDDEKLGSGKEKVDRLTNLIAIFESPDLDFSDNRADGDDLLGDAYEYLMRHFATESGKSKGQFYTPGEVSRLDGGRAGGRTRGGGGGAVGLDHGVRPDLRVGLAPAPRGGDGAGGVGHGAEPLRAGEGRGDGGAGENEHDPARLPGRGGRAREHAHRARLRRRREVEVVRPRGREPAVLGQEVAQRLRAPRGRPLRPLRRLRRPATQAGRLRLPAAHRQEPEAGDPHAAWRPGVLHPAPRRAVPRQRRGGDPRAAAAQGAARGGDRAAGEPLLRHGDPGLRAGARRAGRGGAGERLPRRRQRRLREGRPEEPPAGPRPAPGGRRVGETRRTCPASPAACRSKRSRPTAST